MDVSNSAQGEYTHPVAPELPLYVRANCYQWLAYRLGPVPSTATIKANLGDKGEIGFMYSNGIEHYVVIEEDRGDTLLISETNFGAQKKNVRVIPRSSLVGLYEL